MKIVKMFIFFIYFIIFIPNVSAAECTNAEKVSLGKEAVGVKVGYEEMEGIMDKDLYTPPEGVDPNTYVKYYYYFKINVVNVTENIKVVITNPKNNEEIIVTYDKVNNNLYSFDWFDLEEPTNLKYKILANTYDCNNYKLKEGILFLPAYNRYYKHVKCKGNEKLSICQKYTNTKVTSEIFEREINKKINNDTEKNNTDKIVENNLINNIKEYINNNITQVIIFAILIVIVIGFIIFMLIGKRRRRVI